MLRGGGAARRERLGAAGPTTDLTADQAPALVKEGSASFKTDSPVRAVQGRERRLEIARNQTPFAVLVSCSDSRVPPELLCGRGLGELFIVRNAGNTVDTTALGSIEYGVAQLGVPLVVVLGHERCGAVEAAVSVVRENTQFPGSIGRTVKPIVPAVLSVRSKPGDHLHNAVRANVSRMGKRLRTGKIRIVGAAHDLDDGSVDLLDEA